MQEQEGRRQLPRAVIDKINQLLLSTVATSKTAADTTRN